MNAQVTSRKFGLLAAGLTVLLFGYEVISFVLAGVIGTTTSGNDDGVAILYVILVAFGWLIGMIIMVVAGLGMARDQHDRWIGAVALVMCLALLAISTAIAILVVLDLR